MSSRHRTRDALLRPLIAATLVAAIGLATAPTQVASAGGPHRTGDATLVDAGDHGHHLSLGGSSTEFSITLPSGADCPGDSEHEQWRAQSFLVPAGDDPGTLHYGVVGPDGANQYALYDEDTHPFVDVLTPPNAAPGLPGTIPAIPAFDFAVFPPGLLTPGQYRVGIACTLFRVTATYWDTVIVIAADSTDRPAQLTWRLASAAAGTGGSSSGGSAGPVVAIVAALAVAVAAIALLRRRSRRTHRTLTTSKGTT